MNTQPTVLPWHQEAAHELIKAINPQVAMMRDDEDWHPEMYGSRFRDACAIIARHDEGRTDSPAPRLEKNKHATTLRLLEEAKEYLHDLRGEWSWKEGAGVRNTKALADLDATIDQLATHLAAMKGSQ